MAGASVQLSAPARVVFGNVAAVTSELLRAAGAASSAQPVAIDLAALTEFDSSAVSMLLELSRRLPAPVVVVNPPTKLAELAELYGVADLLGGAAPAAEPGGAAASSAGPH